MKARFLPGERRWVLWYALIVMLLTTIPYWLGFASAGSGWVFTGFVFGVEDGNSYIAKMLSGAYGSWLFRTPYTSMEQDGFLAFLPYILLGKLTTEPGQHEQLVALFHLFRIAAGIVMVFATYDFISLFISERRWRRASLVAATVGGGLGWLFLLVGTPGWGNHLPLEFYSPETFGFLALYGIPHLAMARALLLWGLVLYLLPDPPTRRFRALAAGAVWLLLGFFQPLTVVVGYAVLAAHLLALGILRWFRNRKTGLHEWADWLAYLRKAIVIGMISLPLVVYTALSFWTDPYLRGWSAQNIITSPPPVDYLLAYLLFLPFALLGVKPIVQALPLKGPLLAGWLILFPFLAYAPFQLQRRLPEGIWVAVCVLAFFFLQRLGKNGWRIGAALVVVSMLPAVLLVAGRSLDMQTTAQPMFQPVESVQAFKFLNEYASPGEIVLAAYPTSNALPAWAPLRVVIGHGPESVGLAEMQPKVEAFYGGGMTLEDRAGFLAENNIAYVFWGPDEAALHGQQAWNPEDLETLRQIYDQGSYRIYETRTLDDAAP